MRPRPARLNRSHPGRGPFVATSKPQLKPPMLRKIVSKHHIALLAFATAILMCAISIPRYLQDGRTGMALVLVTFGGIAFALLVKEGRSK